MPTVGNHQPFEHHHLRRFTSVDSPRCILCLTLELRSMARVGTTRGLPAAFRSSFYAAARILSASKDQILGYRPHVSYISPYSPHPPFLAYSHPMYVCIRLV